MRQIVLDTETTGLETSEGHRIIEIGAIEIINRRLTGKHFHRYINPQRDIDAEAIKVHGITREFLADKPAFADICTEFLDFVKGSELIIHNAKFDTGFIDYELQLLNSSYDKISTYCRIIDSLALARQRHPGQKNSLDVLCKRYAVDNSKRDYHGALLDAQLLAYVYLAMTGGQGALFDNESPSLTNTVAQANTSVSRTHAPLRVIKANAEELVQHQQRLADIQKIAKNGCVWLQQQEK